MAGEYDRIKVAYGALNNQVPKFLSGTLTPNEAAQKVLKVHKDFLGVDQDALVRGFSLPYQNKVTDALKKYNDDSKLIGGKALFDALLGSLEPMLGASVEAAAEKGIEMTDEDKVKGLGNSVLEKIVKEK
ncbi:MAG: hypothetical protein ABIB47_05445 [Candidatus Woesearchaeota archaeon]